EPTRGISLFSACRAFLSAITCFNVLALALLVVSPVEAQKPAQQPAPARPSSQEQSPMGGISSAGNFAPVYDAQKRPITAGGFVDSGPVVFEDATTASGLAKWQ